MMTSWTRERSLLTRSSIVLITLIAAGGGLLYLQQPHYNDIFSSLASYNYDRCSSGQRQRLAAQRSRLFTAWSFANDPISKPSTGPAPTSTAGDEDSCLDKEDPLARTHKVLRDLSLNGSSACHNVSTRSFKLVGVQLRDPDRGFDEEGQRQVGPIFIRTDTVFDFWIVSMGGEGKPRCAGGDYYETQLAGERWRSRPRVSDRGDGTYRVSFMVDGGFPGAYTFSASLLFSNFHGLELDAHAWAVPPRAAINRTLYFILVSPARPPAQLYSHDPDHTCNSSALHHDGACSSSSSHDQLHDVLPRCTPRHMHHGLWHGRWTRSWFNHTCQAGPDGRFDQCLPPSHTLCSPPYWCHGRVSLLHSNGWVYSGHCAFHMWESHEAWDCLAGKWLFFWGDSNMQDYIRNTLIFLLGYHVPSGKTINDWVLDRNIEQTFTNPRQPNQTVRISLVFNGHHNVYQDGLGLDTLLSLNHRQKLQLYFNQTSARPHAFIFNTGLHDGQHFPSVADFIAGIDRALAFWCSIFKDASPENVVLRTNVAPAGAGRYKRSNPHKMEIFNVALIERFRQLFPDLFVIDAFDPSFPFHFDHCCSDGGHYGRPPNFYREPWYGKPHQYFVDLMLSHMLLTSICPHPAR